MKRWNFVERPGNRTMEKIEWWKVKKKKMEALNDETMEGETEWWSGRERWWKKRIGGGVERCRGTGEEGKEEISLKRWKNGGME